MAQNEKTITLSLFKPGFNIGQTIYVPQKGGVVEAGITAYEAMVWAEKGNLAGVVSGYKIRQMVIVRRGDNECFPGMLRESDFYTSRKKAEAASKFLEVKVDEEAWKLAVGDRKEKDEKSPYYTGNSNLPPCCAAISEARDILLYCKRESGLIVHERNELKQAMKECFPKYGPKSPLARILGQLKLC